MAKLLIGSFILIASLYLMFLAQTSESELIAAHKADLTKTFDKINDQLYDVHPEKNMDISILWLESRLTRFTFHRNDFVNALNILEQLKKIVENRDCEPNWSNVVIDANRRATRGGSSVMGRPIDKMVAHYIEKHYQQCRQPTQTHTGYKLTKQHEVEHRISHDREIGNERNYDYTSLFENKKQSRPPMGQTSIYDYYSTTGNLAMIQRQIRLPEFQTDKAAIGRAISWLRSKVSQLDGQEYYTTLDLIYKLQQLAKGSRIPPETYDEIMRKTVEYK